MLMLGNLVRADIPYIYVNQGVSPFNFYGISNTNGMVVTLNGINFKNITDIYIGGKRCPPSQIDPLNSMSTFYNVLTLPCDILYSDRMHACKEVAVEMSYNPAWIISLCENSTLYNCIDMVQGKNVTTPTPDSNGYYPCDSVRCVWNAYFAGNIKCYYSPVNNNMAGTFCGTNRACNTNKTCVDARSNYCKSEISFVLPEIDISGTYPLIFAINNVNTTVYFYNMSSPQMVNFTFLERPQVLSVSTLSPDFQNVPFNESSTIMLSFYNSISLEISVPQGSIPQGNVSTIIIIGSESDFEDCCKPLYITNGTIKSTYAFYENSPISFPNNFMGEPTLIPIAFVFTYFINANPIASFLVSGDATNAAVNTITWVSIPYLISVCPFTTTSFVTTPVVVTGRYFYNSSSLRCRFLYDDNAVVEAGAIYVDSTSIMCTLFDTFSNSTYIKVTVTNDGYVYSSSENGGGNSVGITVIGSCSTIKPFSVPINTACECLPGYRDIKTSCVPCSESTYQPLYGQDSCIPCDGTQNTRGTIGNIAIDACICNDGTYKRQAAATTCSECPEGLVCKNGTISVSHGYWRSDAALLPIRCSAYSQMVALACVGGAGVGDSLCHTGYTGPVCGTCISGYGLVNGICVKCQSKTASITVVVFLIFICCIALFVIIRTSTTIRGSGNEAEVNKLREDFGELSIAIKILINYMQMLYYVGRLGANWSHESNTYLSIMTPSSLSPSFFSATCGMPMSIYVRMAVVMTLPFIIAAGLAIFFLLSWVLVPKTILARCYSVTQDSYKASMNIILYIIHPMITLEVFTSLKCVTVQKNSSYMSMDMTVSCDTNLYQTYQTIAALYIIFYVFGLILLMVYKMKLDKKDIDYYITTQMSSSTTSINQYLYFIKGYSTSHYSWEGVVLLRKMTIVLVSTFMTQQFQLLWGGLIMYLSLAVTVYYYPYKSIYDNRMDCAALLALSISVILGFYSFFDSPKSGSVIFAFLVIVNTVAFVYISKMMFGRLDTNIKNFSITKRMSSFKRRMIDTEAPLEEFKIQKKPSNSRFSSSQ